MYWLNSLKTFKLPMLNLRDCNTKKIEVGNNSIWLGLAVEVLYVLYIILEFQIHIWSIRKSFESLVGHISFPMGPTYGNLRLPIFNPLWDLISNTWLHWFFLLLRLFVVLSIHLEFIPDKLFWYFFIEQDYYFF